MKKHETWHILIPRTGNQQNHGSQDLKPGNIPRLQSGQFIGRQTDAMVSVVWMDNRAVAILASNESLIEVHR